MAVDTSLPFRGSETVRAGELTWGVLSGPRFRRMGPDVYVAAEVPGSPLLQVRAALVRGGPSGVATGWSACVALGLDVAPGEVPIEIAVSEGRPSAGPALIVSRPCLTADEIETTDGVRHTSALRTAFDLAARAGPDMSAVDRVIGPLTDAVVAADALARHGGFSTDDLLEFAACRPRRPGVTLVRTVAALLDPGAESPPESRMRVKLVLAGLPAPTTQFPALGYRTDLAWPRFRVALEYDGRDHAVSDRRARDIDRIEALRRAGWLVIVVTARQLARPRWVVDRVREALVSRGWVPEPDAGAAWAPIVRENARYADLDPRPVHG